MNAISRVIVLPRFHKNFLTSWKNLWKHISINMSTHQTLLSSCLFIPLKVAVYHNVKMKWHLIHWGCDEGQLWNPLIFSAFFVYVVEAVDVFRYILKLSVAYCFLKLRPTLEKLRWKAGKIKNIYINILFFSNLTHKEILHITKIIKRHMVR